MFRRRRPLRRPVARARQRLNEAQRLFERGQYDEAAQIFERLADGAAQRGMLDKGADLLVRAGQCYLEVGRVEQAIALGKRSLKLLARAGLRGKAETRRSQIIQALERKGYHKEAAALQEEIETALAGRQRGREPGPLPRGEPSRPKPQLPANCPHCGAPVNLNEVTWAGPDRAECAYCGRMITATVSE
jgi:tetratricopeptide (TPR) repeat protein